MSASRLILATQAVLYNGCSFVVRQWASQSQLGWAAGAWMTGALVELLNRRFRRRPS